MFRPRAVLSCGIFAAALTAIIVPLPGKNTAHLLTTAEANDNTLVIVTTGDAALLRPLVTEFEAVVEQTMPDSGVTVHIEPIAEAELNSDALRDMHADLVLAENVADLVGAMESQSLDTLPADALWNVLPDYVDPAGRWMGFYGNLDGDQLNISALAMAQSSNSKPLAELFVVTVYGMRLQRLMVENAEVYSLLAFGVEAPSGQPVLESLTSLRYAQIYDSNNFYRPSENSSGTIASTR